MTVGEVISRHFLQSVPRDKSPERAVVDNAFGALAMVFGPGTPIIRGGHQCPASER